MPYGWRMIRAWAVGAILACLVGLAILKNWRLFQILMHVLGYLPGLDRGDEIPGQIHGWMPRLVDFQTMPEVLAFLVPVLAYMWSPSAVRPSFNLTTTLGRVGAAVVVVILLAPAGIAARGLYEIGAYPIRELIHGHGEDWSYESYTYGEPRFLRYKKSITQNDKGKFIYRSEFRKDVTSSVEINERQVHGRPRWAALQLILSIAVYYLIYSVPLVAVMLFPPWLCFKIEHAKESPTLRRWFLGGRGGSSRWAGPATLDRHSKKDDEGIYLGRSLFDDDFRSRDISVQDDSHMLTIGMPGSGKSVTSIWPNLLQYKGSAIVIDPKGEHAKLTLGRRQDPSVSGTKTAGVTRCAEPLRNSTAWVLDPFGVVNCYPSARYNVLSEIDLHDNYARTMISAISKSCVPVSEGENKFWEESARQVLDGAIAHVLSTRPNEEHNLPAVADLLLGLDPKTGFADEDHLKETLIDMRMNTAAGGLPQRAAKLFDNLGEKAYGNVTAELLNALKWCTDPAMRTSLAAADFKFEHLCGGWPTTVYIALPFAAMTEQARWLRCLTEIAMQAVLRHRESHARPSPPVLFVLDELPQYGKQLQGVKQGMVTLRDAGMKLWPFVQNLKQLIECFGEEGAKNFESGATIQVFGVNDASTSAWVANKLGSHRISRRDWRRWPWFFLRKTVQHDETPLADAAGVAQELQKSSPLQYVFPVNGRPMRLERLTFRAMEIDGTRFRGVWPVRAPADEHLRA